MTLLGPVLFRPNLMKGNETVASKLTQPIAPDAPTIGTATGGNTQASITFTPPAGTGGSTILDYTMTSTPGNKTATNTESPIVVTGLTNGTEYTFKATARNAYGIGALSEASNGVTPSA